MKIFPSPHALSFVVLGAVAVTTLTQISAQASSLSLNFIGQDITNTGTLFDSTEIGGLSGITFDATNNQYYSISDDQGTINQSRFYTLNIDLSSGQLQQGGVTFTGVTPISQPGEIPFPPGELDPEGIALTNHNSLYISSEGDTNQSVAPFVNEFSLTT